MFNINNHFNSLIYLGQLMKKLMFLEFIKESKLKEHEQKIFDHFDQIVKLNESTLDGLQLPDKLDVLNQGYFKLGKLTYKYLLSKGKKIKYKDICAEISQAFAKSSEQINNHDHQATKALFSPMSCVMELYVYLGKCGIEVMKQLKNNKVLSKENQIKFIKSNIMPLVRIVQAADQYGLLNRNAFNEYLASHMEKQYRQSAENMRIPYINYFDLHYPQSKKHSLRDGYINTILDESEQNEYLIGKALKDFAQTNSTYNDLMRTYDYVMTSINTENQLSNQM